MERNQENNLTSINASDSECADVDDDIHDVQNTNCSEAGREDSMSCHRQSLCNNTDYDSCESSDYSNDETSDDDNIDDNDDHDENDSFL